MPKSDLPDGVHRVKRKLVSGAIRFHFYAFRGGPKFWEGDERTPTNIEFYEAFVEAAERPKPADYMVTQMVDDFLSSAAMPKRQRSKDDIRLWGLRFAAHFETAPAIIFEDRGARAEMNAWRAIWKHSPKQHDMAGTHAVRILNWAVQEGKLSEHYCHKLPRLYEVDRSEIVWTPEDREAFNAVAPDWARRILCAACETGLRPADLAKITRAQIEKTTLGRRLRVRTNKKKRLAHIPVTPALADVIDNTPQDRLLILIGGQGQQLTARTASNAITRYRRVAGLSDDLRLQDCRGTAATRLLNADLELAKIANHMGWSVRYAANVIEHYARVSPDETDAVLIKLEQSQRGAA